MRLWIYFGCEYALDEIPFSEMIFRSQGRDRNLYSFGRAPNLFGALLFWLDERNRLIVAFGDEAISKPEQTLENLKILLDLKSDPISYQSSA